ncbi:MAG: hypothetical protein AB7P76_07935 [Candidatus Melainabacteria bacterium]
MSTTSSGFEAFLKLGGQWLKGSGKKGAARKAGALFSVALPTLLAARGVYKAYAKNVARTAVKTTASQATHGVWRSAAGLAVGAVVGGLVLEKGIGMLANRGGGGATGFDAMAPGGYDPAMMGAGLDPYAAMAGYPGGGSAMGSEFGQAIPASGGSTLDDAWRAYNSLGVG